MSPTKEQVLNMVRNLPEDVTMGLNIQRSTSKIP